MPKIKGNTETKTILGNREHMIRIFGKRVSSKFISVEQWNRYPHSGRASSIH